ncbi:tetraspanin-7-like isoform X2 [Lineus longissimus]|uniref:tetraspanin-7-like isoform X2 n=1 Tax=Lineus longissimus TaxID=88925 RepID=UPI002B4DA786
MGEGRGETTLCSGAAVGCMKTLLLVFNFIFWVTGIALLALGIWMKVQLYIYMELTTTYYAEAPYVLIGIGAAIVVVGSLGCCCTVKGHTVLLYMFSFFLVVIFIAELAIGISGFIFKDKVQTGFQAGMKDGLAKYGDVKTKTEALDNMQRVLGCCGISNYTDWFNTPWEMKQVGKQFIVPASCCKDGASSCQRSGLPKHYGNSTLEIYKDGCYKLVTGFLESNFGIIAGTVIGIAFLMLLGAILSCCLAKNINRSKYEQVA